MITSPSSPSRSWVRSALRACTRSAPSIAAAPSSHSAATGTSRARIRWRRFRSRSRAWGRQGETHTPFLPGERINLPEALAAFTINAAYTNRLEKTTGSIEVGKNADLIVLDHNLFAIPVSEIDKSKVLLTLFAGRPVHGDLGRL